MDKICTNCGKVITRNIHKNTIRPFCNSTCYGKWQQGRKFSEQGKIEREKKICSVEGCTSIHFGRGYCRKHYISLFYSPPKITTKKTTSITYICINCGSEFIAHHKNPKFCSIKCSSENKRKPYILKKGYKKVLIPEHARADKKGYVFEHIVIAEKMIGRQLRDKEEVHHIDRNKQNNDPSNLIVCANHAEHMKYHAIPL